MKRSLWGACCVCASVSLLPIEAVATIRQVPTYAYPTIQSAVFVSEPGDTVQVEPGTYTSCVTQGPTGSLNCIVIEGAPGSPLNLCLTVGPESGVVVVDAQHAGRCIVLKHAGGTRIHDFHFVNGEPNGSGPHGYDGGGMCILASRPVTVVDCIFEDNLAYGSSAMGEGGGLYLSNSTSLVRGSDFLSNESALDGGGARVGDDSTIRLIQCEFWYNYGWDGGGMMVENQSFAEVAGTYFAFNDVWSDGGGVKISSYSTFEGCHASFAMNHPNDGSNDASCAVDLTECGFNPDWWSGGYTENNLACPAFYLCEVTIEPTVQVSVYCRPDCAGDGFNEARTRGGDVVPAIIYVKMRNIDGDPIPNIPANRIWLQQEATAPGWQVCEKCCLRHSRFPFADQDTDHDGDTFFLQPVCAGGQTNPVAGDRIRVMSAWGFVSGPLDIQFNSADLNGDRWVNLTDVSIFAGDIGNPPHYHYRSDFVCDGYLNLSDVTVFAQALGSMCPWSCQ